jgi:hypothetical protein
MNKFKFYCNHLTIILSCLAFGCVNTEGNLDIEGNVKDEYTNSEIPYRNMIVQGVLKRNEKPQTIEVAQFSTDSSGKFKHTLKKIKDVRYYNFILVGDSNYAEKTKELGLYEIEQNSKFLSFSLCKFADLTIIINRKSKKPDYDTLSLAWDSNDIYFWSLFPYKIYNYDKSSKYTISSPANELRWYGGYVNSVVKTKVFAEKKTKIYWDLNRNGKRIEFIDTLTCKRDFINRIYFSY